MFRADALAFGEAVLALLARGGVGDQAAAWALDLLTLYVNTAALEHSTHLHSDGNERARWYLDTMLDGMLPARHRTGMRPT